MDTELLRRRARDFVARLSNQRVLDSASASAFWLFLSLLPLAAVAVLVAVKLVAADVTVLRPLLAAVPDSSRALVSRELGRVAAWHGGTVGPLSASVFVWLASTGVHAILDAFDATTETRRPWWKKRLVALGICVGLSVCVAALGVFFDNVDGAVLSRVAHGPLRYVFAFAAEYGLIAALFTLGIPKKGRHDLRRWPGAVVAAVLQTVFGWGYVYYVQSLGGGIAYSAATLWAIGVTMTVVYLFTLSLLIGVTFNAVLAAHPSHRTEPRFKTAMRRHAHGSSSS